MQYSAYAPMAVAVTTRSPTLMATTSRPTAATVPHTSLPTTKGSSRAYVPDLKVGVDVVDADSVRPDQDLADTGFRRGFSTPARTSGPPVSATSIACMSLSSPVEVRMKLARPDVFHPKIVLGLPPDGRG